MELTRSEKTDDALWRRQSYEVDVYVESNFDRPQKKRLGSAHWAAMPGKAGPIQTMEHGPRRPPLHLHHQHYLHLLANIERSLNRCSMMTSSIIHVPKVGRYVLLLSMAFPRSSTSRWTHSPVSFRLSRLIIYLKLIRPSSP